MADFPLTNTLILSQIFGPLQVIKISISLTWLEENKVLVIIHKVDSTYKTGEQ